MTKSKERLAQTEALPETKIDSSDLAEMDGAFFKAARLIMPAGTTKQAISLRVDDDVLEWFKAGGKGHLSRMNAVLRAYMLAHAQERT
ncbi:BrnA antitoxin family protein [Aquidulcibacter sp.]|uniref:BrnA antitoxin family protein n=1 Tax=Aquidulcibacter sp. TaxID=2052990 RepID=UPI0025C10FA5|nr:BrnA antitoxin family protein [Aquidulcibacter sp.]